MDALTIINENYIKYSDFAVKSLLPGWRGWGFSSQRKIAIAFYLTLENKLWQGFSATTVGAACAGCA